MAYKPQKLAVADGGVGVSTLTDKGVLYGNGTGAIGATAVGTAGQVLTSNGTGVAPTFQAAGGGGMSIGGTVTSGTTGSVLFVGAASALTQDNANLFWDDTNNRLGIGTTTPAQSLDVVGTVQMTGVKLTTSPTAGYVLTSDGAGVGTWAVPVAGSMTIGGAVGSGTSGSVLFVDGSGNLAQDNTNLNFDDATNTLTLGGDLSILNTTSSINFPAFGGTPDPMITMGAAQTGNSRMVLSASDAFPTYGLRFEDGVSEWRFHVVSAGTPFASFDFINSRVGIGVSSPTSAFQLGVDLTTSSNIDFTSDLMSINFPAIGGSSAEMINMGATVSGNNRMVLAYSAGSTYGLRFDDIAATCLHFVQAGVPFVSYDLANGRLGIGVSAPSSVFQVGVAMTTDSDINITSDQASINFPAIGATAQEMINMGATNSGNTRMALAYNAGSGYGLSLEDGVSVARMHFTNSGTPFATFDLGSARVGIGVAAPTTAFQVGVAMTTDSDIIFTADTAGFTLPAISGGATELFDLGSTNGTNTRMLFAYSVGSTYGLRYDDTAAASFNFTTLGTSFACFDIVNGRTGFGTTAPTHFVEVNGGNLAISSAGNGIKIAEGTNARMGVTTLSGGTQTVSTTAVSASSRIFLTAQVPGGAVGAVYISSVSAGTSFDITSTSALDTSDVAWLIIDAI